MDLRPSHQRGMTLVSFLLLFVLVGFVTLLILKVAPIYFEHYKIQSTLNSLKSESDIIDKTPKEIINMLQKRWDINSITKVTAQDSLVVEKQADRLNIHVDYEVEEHLLGNLSVLVKFKDSLNIGDGN